MNQPNTIYCKTGGEAIGTSSLPNQDGYECSRCFEKRELKKAMIESKVISHDNLTDDDLKKIVEEVKKEKPESLEFSYGERINAEIKKLKDNK